MGFDHLIFDTDETRLPDAIRTLSDFNCIQVKKAVDADFLRGEYKTIAAIANRYDSPQPPYQHMYRTLAGAARPDYALLKLIQTEPIYSILTGHLGSDDLVTSTHYASALRHVASIPVEEVSKQEEHSAEPFHQDSHCSRPETFGKMIIVWLLMSPNKSGIDLAPSLKLIPGPVRALLPIEESPIHPWSRDLELSHKSIEEVSAEGGIWIPNVEIGDAIIFTGYCPHGTYVAPKNKPDRFSCEIKVWANHEKIHNDFFSAAENHPGHIVVNRHFIVGPTDIVGLGDSQAAGTRPDLSSGKSDYYKLAFTFGRIEDNREYRVMNRAPAAIRRDMPGGSLLMIDIPGQAGDHFTQVLRSAQTGRTLIRIPRDLKPTDIRPGNDILCGPGATGFDNAADRDVSFVTYLRDPMTRVLDQIYAMTSKPSWSEIEDYLDASPSLSILPDHFAQITDQGRNDSGMPFAFSGDEQVRLAIALKNIEVFFPIVGIDDMFADAAFALFDRFGWPRIGLPDTSPLACNHPTAADLPDHIRTKIDAKLHADRQIYAFCRRRLADNLAQADLGIEFENFRRDYAHMTRVLQRTHETLTMRTAESTRNQFHDKSAAIQKLNRSLESLNAAREKEIEQLYEKIGRMEASYTALLKQHLESLNIPTQ